MRNHFLLVAVLVGACGAPKLDPQQELAKVDTQQALEGAAHAREALEIFGLLPNYSCGPIENAIGKALPPIEIPFSCVSLKTRDDGLDLTFDAAGCDVAGHQVKGTLALNLGIGSDRIDVTADFRQLSIDGRVLPVKIGAGVCGDEKRIWATIDGAKIGADVFRLDAQLGYRKGLPLIGKTELILDGTGSLEQPAGKTEVAAEGLTYEVGDLLPNAGRLTVNRSDGTHFSVKFTEVLWKVGKAEITVGDKAPVEVPIVN